MNREESTLLAVRLYGWLFLCFVTFTLHEEFSQKVSISGACVNPLFVTQVSLLEAGNNLHSSMSGNWGKLKGS